MIKILFIIKLLLYFLFVVKNICGNKVLFLLIENKFYLFVGIFIFILKINLVFDEYYFLFF